MVALKPWLTWAPLWASAPLPQNCKMKGDLSGPVRAKNLVSEFTEKPSLL